jgi:hypothetical protein
MCLLYFLLAIVVLMNIAEDAVGDRDIPGASGAQVTTMVMAELGDAFGTVVKSSEIK